MISLTDRLIAPDMAPREARNARRHVAALSLSKLSDGLVDPKLVLSWLLGSMGVPAAFIGMLVPIREAGALLPQIVLGGWLSRLRHRRWVWVTGSAVQGVAAIGIALAALWTRDALAGVVVCTLLACLAVARAACSVSYKDILGKTVGQSRRGAVTGLAGSVSAAAVVVFAALMLTGVLKSEGALIAAIAVAGLAWLVAALVLAGLREEDSTPDGASPVETYREILRRDANLRRFILVRGLLVSTALAPPYMVLLTAQEGRRIGHAGGDAAGLVSGRVCQFLCLGTAGGSRQRPGAGPGGRFCRAAMLAAMAAQVIGLAQGPGVIPAILFVLMLAYHGVRQARSVYLVDISDPELRAQNAAIANTAIGAVLLLAGLIGGALSFVGPLGALAGFAAMALAGGAFALTLRRVQRDPKPVCPDRAARA